MFQMRTPFRRNSVRLRHSLPNQDYWHKAARRTLNQVRITNNWRKMSGRHGPAEQRPRQPVLGIAT